MGFAAEPFQNAEQDSNSASGKTDFENAFKKRKLQEMAGDCNLCNERAACILEVPNPFASPSLAPVSPESPAKEVFAEASPSKCILEHRADATQIDDGYR